MKFTHSVPELTPFYPWVCLHHPFSVRNLILRCLTGSHITILSKSNSRVRLHVNIDIADSISFYFNFGKGHYFVLRLKQHFFGKARFFKTNRLNPAIVDWREREVDTCARRLPVVSYPWIFRTQTIRAQAQTFRTHLRSVRTQPSGRFVPNKLWPKMFKTNINIYFIYPSNRKKVNF